MTVISATKTSTSSSQFSRRPHRRHSRTLRTGGSRRGLEARANPTAARMRRIKRIGPLRLSQESLPPERRAGPHEGRLGPRTAPLAARSDQFTGQTDEQIDRLGKEGPPCIAAPLYRITVF